MALSNYKITVISILFIFFLNSLFSESPDELYRKNYRKQLGNNSKTVELVRSEKLFNEIFFSIDCMESKNGIMSYEDQTKIWLHYDFCILKDSIIFLEVHDENVRWNEGDFYMRFYVYNRVGLYYYDSVNKQYTYLKDGKFLEGKSVNEVLTDMKEGYEKIGVDSKIPEFK
ncbi:MAG: hypothetical protein IKX23_07550 [Treponema sp.]|nr:hypothetical protein [Treponema sp.]